MVNESPDGRRLEVEPWETEQIPCVHFVNYNSDECDFNSGAASSDEASAWTEMNIEETMAVLTRCSFDEAHRQPIFNLGGIPALAELIQVNQLLFFVKKCKKKRFIFRRSNVMSIRISRWQRPRGHPVRKCDVTPWLH